MASIRERKTKAGERTWAVLYRDRGRQTSMTFTDKRTASKFKSLVDNLGAADALAALNNKPQDDGITVAELAEKYLAWKKRDVTPRTIEQYRRDIGNWVLPTLGERSAESVDEADVQRWVDTMADELSPKSVADRHMLLHSMYDFGRAKSRRLVDHNPCLETDLPKRKKRPVKGATVPEYRAILEAAAEHNPDARDLIEFLGDTGWRPSEAAALPVKAVEVVGEDVWVTVVQTFQIIDNRQVLVADEAKTSAAFRRIRPLPDSAATIRRRIVGKGPEDFVFTNSRGRPWNQGTFLRDTWPGILKKAGLYRGPRKGITPYWLRHTHVAVCAAANIPMHEIQRRVGHENYGTTVGVYGTMIGDISDEAMDRAADIIGGRRKADGVAPIVRGEVVMGELGQ